MELKGLDPKGENIMRKIPTLFLTLVLVLVATCVYAVDFRRAKNFEDAFNASCRVSVSNARGTGTFIGVDNESGNALILTNYHVVTNNTRATVDFWTNGEKQSVSGQVIARFYDAKKPADFALIAVNANELKRIDPPFVALAGKDGTPDANSYILSAGAPKGLYDIAVFRLAPVDYHRFHFPCDCTSEGSVRVIPGEYHSVNTIALLHRPDVYADNERQVLKCHAAFGDFWLVDVGAFGVGTIVQTFSGEKHSKGDEKGYFKFGGSTVILVARAGAIKFDDDLVKNSADGLETRVLCGERIGVPA